MTAAWWLEKAEEHEERAARLKKLALVHPQDQAKLEYMAQQNWESAKNCRLNAKHEQEKMRK